MNIFVDMNKLVQLDDRASNSWDLNKMLSFLLIFLLVQNSILNVDFFELFSIESVFKSFSKVILVGLEGVEIPSFSNLELCDSFVFLDKNGCINNQILFLAAAVLVSLASLAALLPLASSRNFLKSVIFLG